MNEVLNGIARAGALAEATLGTIPLGTGNSFLADFGLQSIEAMIERIASGADGSPTDLMRCRFARGNDVEGWLVDERLALNNLIVGFGADVGSLMNRRLKFLGKFGYTAGVMIELARLNPPSMTVEVDGSAADGTMTMVNVGNSQYTGGNMQIAPDAIVDDGLLDVIAIGPLSRLKLVAAFRLIFTGAHVDHPAVNVTKGRSVRIAAERPLPLLMDGDCIGATPVEIEVAPCALKVLR